MRCLFSGSPYVCDSNNELFHVFNADISKWDVSSVTDMYGTFSSATHFNVDISGWNVANVITMEFVYRNANNFNQNLCAWKNYSNFPYHVDDVAMFHWTSCE